MNAGSYAHWTEELEGELGTLTMDLWPLAENLELLRVGYDALLGNYSNKWAAESGATPSSPKIDWTTSAHPLISYAPPYNASDTPSRDAVSRLGFVGFSASTCSRRARSVVSTTVNSSPHLRWRTCSTRR